MAHKIGNSGPDSINGTVFQDTLEGLGGDDIMWGRDADDLLQGGADNDILLGGDGDDRLEGGAEGDELWGGDGDDDVFGGDGDDTLSGGNEDDSGAFNSLHGGSDELFGGEGNDVITFSWEDLTVQGGGGNDRLVFDPRKDPASLTADLDHLPQIQGGSGTDTLESSDPTGFFGLAHTMSVNLLFNMVQISFDPNDPNNNPSAEFGTSIAGVENVTGAALHDELTGDEIGNVLKGMGGADTLDGGDGDDVLYDDQLGAGDELATVTTDGAQDIIDGGGGDDNIHFTGGTDQIDGGTGNDIIHVLTAGFGRIDGGVDTAGDEVRLYQEIGIGGSNPALLIGDNGGVIGIERLTLMGHVDYDIILSVPMLNAASGKEFEVTGSDRDDTIDGSRGASDVEITMHGGLGSDRLTGGDGVDVLEGNKDGDTLSGGDGDDTLEGDDGADTLDGGAGADTLAGGHGDDILLQSSGDDSFDGGGGRDTLDFDGLATPVLPGAAAVVVDLAAGTATFALLGQDSITSVEDVLGSEWRDVIRGDGHNNALNGRKGDDQLEGADGNDTLEGGKGDDTLRGGRGDDTISGGKGSDTLDFTEANKAIVVSLEVVGVQDTGQGLDTLTSIENVTGGAFDDGLSGSAGSNRLTGGGGADVLLGLGGEDAFAYVAAGDCGSDAGTYDTIGDFEAGLDVIDLAKLYDTLGISLSFVGTAEDDNSVLGQVSLLARGSGDTFVKVNLTLDRGSEMKILLTGVDAETLTAADFIA